MIERPLRSGSVVPFGRYFATGSVSFKSRVRTMSTSSSAVNTFVTDAISNTVSPGQRAAVGSAGFAISDNARSLFVEHADDDAHAALRPGDRLNALLDEAVNLAVGRQCSHRTRECHGRNDEEPPHSPGLTQQWTNRLRVA